MFYDHPGGRLRLGLLVLLDDLVVGQLLAGGTLQELLHAVAGIVPGALRLIIRLIWPPYQADMAPYQANTHRYQAVSWRRETTLI